MRNYYVYIMSNWNHKVLYTGMTNNLEKRVLEHKQKLMKGFTEKYNVTKLVYFDYGSDVKGAIETEKKIKGWRREKKVKLIERMNPNWQDLSEQWFPHLRSLAALRDDMGAASFRGDINPTAPKDNMDSKLKSIQS